MAYLVKEFRSNLFLAFHSTNTAVSLSLSLHGVGRLGGENPCGPMCVAIMGPVISVSRRFLQKGQIRNRSPRKKLPFLVKYDVAESTGDLRTDF